MLVTHPQFLRFAPGQLDIPIGAVTYYTIDPEIEEDLPADGAEVSRATYALLYAEQGDAYGPGDSATTFDMIDLRGRVPKGEGAELRGVEGGEEDHQINIGELPSHTHTVNRDTNSVGNDGGAHCTGGGNTSNSNSQGGNGAHNTMQASVALLAFVRALE